MRIQSSPHFNEGYDSQVYRRAYCLAAYSKQVEKNGKKNVGTARLHAVPNLPIKFIKEHIA
jgi:hypothetical protein